jgi:hypothetical protein
MPGWPITLGLAAGGPSSFFAFGLGGGGHPMGLNPKRTLIPAAISGYVGRDFPPLSALADDVFAIDLGAALDGGDRLDPATLATMFFPVDAPVTGYAEALDGPPSLIGTVAAQAIGRAPAGRYVLGFTCATNFGRQIQLHSYFTAVGIPNAA